jgi:acyl-homoserine lactone acylase PvdQ
MSKVSPRALASLFSVLTVLAAAPASAQQPDTGLYMNIIPPGQNGRLTAAEALEYLSSGDLPPYTEDQSPLYANLSQAPPGITVSELVDYFKPAPFTAPEVPTEVVNTPKSGVTITRDAFGVPHIKARSRKKLMYGIGYAQARDRLFSMDLLRRAGRGRVSEFAGPDAFALSQDESLYQFAGYDDADLQQQLDQMLERKRGRARRVLRDIDAFIEGVNAVVVNANIFGGQAPAEYAALGLLPIELWTRLDVLAVATQLEQLFGAGGGREHRNAVLLQKLQAAYGATTGRALYDDLRHKEDLDTSTTSELSFPYLVQGTIDPAAVAMVDVGSVVQSPMVQVTGPLPSVTAGLDLGFLKKRNPNHPSMSNFLGITAEHADGGHPIAVMGPQTGYFIPEILVEFAMDGGGMKARGVAPLGTPYIVLGRGRSYAWSATAGGSDNTDVRAELLCEPGGGAPSIMSTHYMYDGQCTPMFQRTDTWCSGDGTFCSTNPDNITATVERTVHGIVFARATVGGAPVALARERATFFREGENAIAFTKINRRTRTAKSFARAISAAPGSFNWLYVNQDDISFFHSGVFPVRAAGVDFDMPTWGTGEWEWLGEVDRDDHPQEINPTKGFFTSWNNKPARDWSASDSNYSFGATHRVDSLDDRLEARIGGAPITIGEMVEFMGDAAHVDLRGAQVLPLALSIIGSEPTLAAELTILDDWVSAGAFRRDRDGDGDYDNASAVAIMDAWFEEMIHAVFDGQLGAFYGDIPLGFDDEPGAIGSAYQSGYYGLLKKVFKTVLGQPLNSPLSVLQCADGTPSGCRTALVNSLNSAVAALTTEFASSDPNDWAADPEKDQIEFTVFGLAETDPIPWQNRPTFQQVVQVTSKRPQ